jgi:hypothetical protein
MSFLDAVTTFLVVPVVLTMVALVAASVPVHVDSSADDAFVAVEPFLPQPITDQQNGIGGWPILRDRKQPPTNRSYSEQRQEILADRIDCGAPGPGRRPSTRTELVGTQPPIQNVVLRPPLEIVGERDGRAVVTELMVRGPDHHQMRGGPDRARGASTRGRSR